MIISISRNHWGHSSPFLETMRVAKSGCPLEQMAKSGRPPKNTKVHCVPWMLALYHPSWLSKILLLRILSVSYLSILLVLITFGLWLFFSSLILDYFLSTLMLNWLHTVSSSSVNHSSLLFFAFGGLYLWFLDYFGLVAKCITHACAWRSYTMSPAHIIQPTSQHFVGDTWAAGNMR